jgi:histone-lysine N-methyltransferase SETD3
LIHVLLQDYGNEVRGCHATQEILENEVVIDIPLKCLITVEMGKETDV